MGKEGEPASLKGAGLKDRIQPPSAGEAAGIWGQSQGKCLQQRERPVQRQEQNSGRRWA